MAESGDRKLAVGIAIGLGIGAALFAATGNVVFLAVGISIGVAIGASLREEDQKTQDTARSTGALIAVLGGVALLILISIIYFIVR